MALRRFMIMNSRKLIGTSGGVFNPLNSYNEPSKLTTSNMQYAEATEEELADSTQTVELDSTITYVDSLATGEEIEDTLIVKTYRVRALAGRNIASAIEPSWVVRY